MPIEKRKTSINKEYESNNSNWSTQLTWWIVIIWIVLVMFIIFTFSKFSTLSNSDNSQIQALERKIKNLESKISTLEKQWDWEVYHVNYEWWSTITNNLKWIWEKSLWFPDYLKWKNCYILWSKISWEDGWTVRWFLWKNGNGSSYSFATSYEARVNNAEEKIEITKRNWSSSMLTKTERDNLYFALTLLCR